MYSNKDYYAGSLIKMKRNGKGSYHYNNGDIYEGEWHNDKKHGKGELILSNNKGRCQGEFD